MGEAEKPLSPMYRWDHLTGGDKQCSKFTALFVSMLMREMEHLVFHNKHSLSLPLARSAGPPPVCSSTPLQWFLFLSSASSILYFALIYCLESTFCTCSMMFYHRCPLAVKENPATSTASCGTIP